MESNSQPFVRDVSLGKPFVGCHSTAIKWSVPSVVTDRNDVVLLLITQSFSHRSIKLTSYHTIPLCSVVIDSQTIHSSLNNQNSGAQKSCPDCPSGGIRSDSSATTYNPVPDVSHRRDGGQNDYNMFGTLIRTVFVSAQ